MKQEIWKNPPVIKIYEALGALADGRIKNKEGEWRVYSSSGNKFYIVKYNNDFSALMSNDNGSYWQGYLGYPMIVFLMKKGVIKYNQEMVKLLRGIKWKDINMQNKNDYNKTIDYCLQIVKQRGGDVKEFLKEVENIKQQIKQLKIRKLGKRIKPSNKY